MVLLTNYDQLYYCMSSYFVRNIARLVAIVLFFRKSEILGYNLQYTFDKDYVQNLYCRFKRKIPAR